MSLTVRAKTKTTTTTRTQGNRTQSLQRSTTNRYTPILPRHGSSSSRDSSDEDLSSFNRYPGPSHLPIRKRSNRLSDSSSESDDPEFGSKLRKEVKEDSKALRKVEKEKKRKLEIKKYKDRGEAVPEELKLSSKDKKRIAKGKGVKKEKELKPEEKALLERIVPGRGKPLTIRDVKGKGKAKEESDSDDDEVPTRPIDFAWNYKKTDVEKRNKIKLLPTFDNPYETPLLHTFTREEILQHLSRRWVRKSAPLAMNARRKQLELEFNPLIRMLDVKIVVVEDGDDVDTVRPGDSDETSSSDEEDDDSDPSSQTRKSPRKKRKSKRNRQDRSTVAYHTDDEEREEGKSRKIGDFDDDSEDDTDWGTDGMEGLSRNWPSRSSTREQSDVKPKLKEIERTEASWSNGRIHGEQEADRKPDIEMLVLDDDDGREPPTQSEEDEPKPTVRSVPPHASTSTSTVSRILSSIKVESAPDMNSGDVSFVEPDTEPSDEEPLFPSNPNPQSRQSTTISQSIKGEEVDIKLDRGQQYALEIQRAEEALERRIERESQSQSQPAASFPISTIDTSQSLTFDDEGEDEYLIDEQTLLLLKDNHKRSVVEDEKRAKMDRKQQRKKARAAREQVSFDITKKEDVEDEAQKQLEKLEEEDADEDETERPAWDVVNKEKASTVTFPYLIKKGRPKFLVQNREQHRTGPHLLSGGAEIPAPINKFLRPYQREGVEFLWGQFQKGLGGVLGDDMGLGKTIQVIAFLSAVMGKTGFSKSDVDKRKKAIEALPFGESLEKPSNIGPTCLIACPASVKHNWEREFKLWGYFDVAVFGGDKESRANTLKRFNRGYIDVLIVGMEGVRDHIDDFAQLDLTLVIVDEAHRLKNPRSATTQAFHAFPTPYRYGLTGTAIQNDLDELWCLLNWANPGHVGTAKQWRDLLSRPLKLAQSKEATIDELALGRTRAAALVGNLLPHFWLRRTKDSVKLQLPAKRDNVVLCPLTDLQKDVYRRILDLEDVEIMLTADEPCPCGEKDSSGLPYKRAKCCNPDWVKMIFKYITLFQKISNHLALIYPDNNDKRANPEKYEQDLVWAKAAFPDDYEDRRPNRMAFADPDLCGKWKVLCELLERWYKKGDKVLIFSMSLKVLDLLTDLMETTRYKFVTLDGSTPGDERMDRVDQFNDPEGDVFAFLISTRAGGVGLNLKAANKVVIFDPNWNPSHDLQAMDRTHRFGQTREVDVYRLIGAGTLEELILNRQQYKRAQAGIGYDATAERRLYSGVQGEGKALAGELWGVKNIFKFNEESLTEMVIEKMKVDELEYTRSTDGFNDKDEKTTTLLDGDEEAMAEDLLADVLGSQQRSKSKTRALSAAETERLRLREDERSAIARILGGRITVESNSVLGGSKVEDSRTREALKVHAAESKSKSKSRNSVPSAPPPPPQSVPRKRSSLPSTDVKPDVQKVYDPMSRGKKKRIKRE